MTSKAISTDFDLPEGLRFSDSAAVPAAVSHRLDGTYRIVLSGSIVEIELVETTSLYRSVVYAAPGQELVLRVAQGEYCFWLRPLGKPEPTRIRFSRMGIAARATFFVTKAWQVVARGGGIPAAIAYIRGRVGSGGGAGIQAARLLALPPQLEPIPIRAREPMAPAVERSNEAVSIIIPTKDRFDLLRACVASLAAISHVTYEIIIVDNGATAPAMLAYLNELGQNGQVRIVRREIPFNFSQLCNDGARVARSPLLLFMNDDVEAQDNVWLSAMRDLACREEIGVVGARLLFPSGDLQHGGIATNLIPGPGHPWRNVPPAVWKAHPLLAEAGEVDAVTGACLMVRKAVFDQVGGFDEEQFAITLNDVDLCLRVRRLGLKIIYAPQATLYHKEGQTRDSDQSPKEIERYRRELAAFYRRHEAAARTSVFYPQNLRRDTDAAIVP